MNEIAQLCERLDADVDMVRRGIGSDERIGKRFLFPGIGYGGSCFPKDVQALVKSSNEVNYDFSILNAVMNVNERQKLHLMPKIRKYFNNNLKGKKFALWGLAFKPNTDDMREAPSLVIVPMLEAQGARVRAYDPQGMAEARKLMPRLETAADPYACIEGADAMVILTEWDQFRALDLDRVKAGMRSPVVVDLRNIYKPADMTEKGFTYVSVGRG